MSLDGLGSYLQQNGQMASALYRSDEGSVRYPSLMGTESELRELNMIDVPSHELNTSGDASDYVDEPQTPKTPEGIEEENSCHTKSPLSQHKSSANATPRQETFSTARTHQIAVPSSIPLPASEPPASQKPLLGILRTTPDSFVQMELCLYDRLSHWGRHPRNTFVHEDIFDVRIPKRAFLIWFHAFGIERAEREGRDWRSIHDLHTIINTNTSSHIWVNGEKLRATYEDGEMMCGRLYTGDVIEIFSSRNRDSGSQQTLKFVCEFYVGEAEMTRPEDRPFKPERGVEPSQPRQSF